MGNIADFDARTICVDYQDMTEIDRLAMHKLQCLIEKVLAAYENYEFHVAYHAIHKFCVVDMSAFYLDIIKDRLYVENPADAKRRSAQSVLFHVLNALLRLIAPVLSFTAEEIYSFLPKNADAPISVQLLDMPQVREEYKDDTLAAKWDGIMAVREVVSKELETARQEKVIGHPLSAAVTIYADAETKGLLDSLGAELPFVFIVSQVRVLPLAEKPVDLAGSETIAVSVQPASGEKCERCWIYSDTVGSDAEHPTLCSRCAAIVKTL